MTAMPTIAPTVPTAVQRQTIAMNCQEDLLGYVDDRALPLIAILHEDGSGRYGTDFLRAWVGFNVWAYRGMSPFSMAYMALPHAARFIFDNEADFDYDPPAWLAYVVKLKTDRPDIVLIAPASNTVNWPADGDWPEDPDVRNMCYFYALHIPNFASVNDVKARVGSWGNPWCVTEVEADFTDPDNQNSAILAERLMRGAQTALTAGAQCAAIWGKDPMMSDAVRIPALRRAVIAFNATKPVSSAVPLYLMLGSHRH